MHHFTRSTYPDRRSHVAGRTARDADRDRLSIRPGELDSVARGEGAIDGCDPHGEQAVPLSRRPARAESTSTRPRTGFPYRSQLVRRQRAGIGPEPLPTERPADASATPSGVRPSAITTATPPERAISAATTFDRMPPEPRRRGRAAAREFPASCDRRCCRAALHRAFGGRGHTDRRCWSEALAGARARAPPPEPPGHHCHRTSSHQLQSNRSHLRPAHGPADERLDVSHTYGHRPDGRVAARQTAPGAAPAPPRAERRLPAPRSGAWPTADAACSSGSRPGRLCGRGPGRARSPPS